ncbi:hypothetical protein AMECASPLE_001572 [Ameca splendens]|uniref:Uncharacterized protein n=1 Tax=Ameca splendens TaxID=208324 RepID=A0ABV0YKG9_9TELE
MNHVSSLLLPHWIKPAGSLLIPSFRGSRSVNPVHPPSSIAPTTETLGPSIILAHQYSQSPVPRVINLLVSPPPSGGSLLQIIGIQPNSSEFQPGLSHSSPVS